MGTGYLGCGRREQVELNPVRPLVTAEEFVAGFGGCFLQIEGQFTGQRHDTVLRAKQERIELHMKLKSGEGNKDQRQQQEVGGSQQDNLRGEGEAGLHGLSIM
jgi:hypothetical protein